MCVPINIQQNSKVTFKTEMVKGIIVFKNVQVGGKRGQTVNVTDPRGNTNSSIVVPAPSSDARVYSMCTQANGKGISLNNWVLATLFKCLLSIDCQSKEGRGGAKE